MYNLPSACTNTAVYTLCEPIHLHESQIGKATCSHLVK